MEYGDHLRSAERATAALAGAFGSGSLDVTVPTCPDWKLRDLATHAGEFSAFWTHLLCEGTGRPKTPYEPIPEDRAVADWYEGLGGHLLAALASTPPDTEVWTWLPDQHDARFVARRVANELSVHAFDASLARGEDYLIDPDLAADGIEEIFVMAEALREQGHPETGCGEGEKLHLHPLDHEGEWLLTLGRDGLRVDRRHDRGDLALRGRVADLELILYQRPPVGEVEQIGDPAALSAWYRAFKFG